MSSKIQFSIFTITNKFEILLHEAHAHHQKTHWGHANTNQRMRMHHHTYDLHKSCAGSKFQRIPMFCLCIRQASHIALKIKIIRFFGFLHHPSKFLGILWLVQVMWTSFFTINRHRVSEQFLCMWFWNVPRPAFLSLTNLIFRFATLQGCKFAFGCGDCGKTVILVCSELQYFLYHFVHSCISRC